MKIELIKLFTIIIGLLIGFGLYDILKSIALKIRHKALQAELDELSKSPILKNGFKITLEKVDSNIIIKKENEK